jgi:hypothetical protein
VIREKQYSTNERFPCQSTQKKLFTCCSFSIKEVRMKNFHNEKKNKMKIVDDKIMLNTIFLIKHFPLIINNKYNLWA